MRSAAELTRLGAYALHETLGYGPTGIVYRATDTEGRREIALKVTALAAEDEADKLLRDLHATNAIHVATNLRHPGIVCVHRVDTIEEQVAAEMEYVRGMSLRDLLGIAGRLLPERAVSITAQMLDALAYAHAKSALHRNLKPTNVLVRHDGLVKLTDFAYNEPRPDPRRTYAAPIYAYRAPEELEDSSAVDRRADLWSVGVLLFQMLTGHLPFPVSDPHDRRAWQRGLSAHDSTPLSAVLPDSPADLSALLTKALARNPEHRFNHARAFLNGLLETGLCAGFADFDEENEEREEATYKRADPTPRAQPRDENGLAPSAHEPTPPARVGGWDPAAPLHAEDLLDSSSSEEAEPEPRSLALTSEQRANLQQAENQLDSRAAPLKFALVDLEPPAPHALGRGTFPTLPSLPISEPPPPIDSGTRASKAPAPKARINPNDGAELILIPAGDFIMGSDGYSEENSPRRTVSLDAFYSYRDLVTVAQYRRFCEMTGHPMPHAYWQWEETHPIVGVTWHEAAAYCEWAEVHLPTEAQWEKAARGVDGRAFPWGDQFDQRSDHRLLPKNVGRTVPVGSYPAGASPYGVMDVVGNVQQWCLDLYDEEYYKSAPAANPPGPAFSRRNQATRAGLVQKLFNRSHPWLAAGVEQRVVRGSSWKDYHESFSYVFRRDAFPAELRLPWVGFRCVTTSLPTAS